MTDDALEQCDRIIETIDGLDDSALDRGADFFDSVREKVEAIRENIEEHNRVTDGQLDALDNMESGVNRWVR